MGISPPSLACQAAWGAGRAEWPQPPRECPLHLASHVIWVPAVGGHPALHPEVSPSSLPPGRAPDLASFRQMDLLSHVRSFTQKHSEAVEIEKKKKKKKGRERKEGGGGRGKRRGRQGVCAGEQRNAQPGS